MTYNVFYSVADITIDDPNYQPDEIDSLSLTAGDLEEAIAEAFSKLSRKEHTYISIWDASILNPNDKECPYQIIGKKEILIDPNTGRRYSNFST